MNTMYNEVHFTMSKAQILEALKHVNSCEIWTPVSEDDGEYFQVSKASIRRSFENLAETAFDLSGKAQPIEYKARIVSPHRRGGTLLING